MNVKALYKRVIEVLTNELLLVTKHKYDHTYFGSFSNPHVAMHIFILKSDEFTIYPSYELDRIHVKKYTYNRKSV